MGDILGAEKILRKHAHVMYRISFGFKNENFHRKKIW